ncbi:unnamed protein product [Debaryomyces tyrocola]|nr:unnamed protein product [Debaryomyces tyrocola]
MSNQSNDIAVKSAGESFGSNNSTDLTEKDLAVRSIRDEEAQAPKEKKFIESDAGDGSKREDQYLHGPKLALCFVAIFLCLFLVALDQTIVATLLTVVGNKFNGFDKIGWLSAGFLLSMAVFAATWGKISIIFGRKITMFIAIILFEAGSLMCALANDMNVLIGGRVLAGVGGGGIQSMVFILISEIVPLEVRPLGMAGLGCTFAVASVLGPLIGGAFTSNVSWRWSFYINLPIGGIAAAFFFWAFNPPKTKGSIREKLKMIDYLGTALLSAGLVVFLLALTFGAGDQFSWDSAAVICCFVLGGAVLIVFCIWNFKYSKNPIIPPDIVKALGVDASTLMIFGMFGYFMAIVLYVSIYFQVIHGADAWHSGLHLLPIIIPVVLTSISSGILIHKTRFVKPFGLFGAIMGPIGIGLLCLLDVDSSSSRQIGLLIISGISCGFQMQSALISSQISAPKTPGGTILTTTFVNFGRAVGGTIGADLADAVYSAAFQNNFATALSNLNDKLILSELSQINERALVTSTDLIKTLSPGAQLFVKNQVMEAIRNVFYMSLGFSALGLIGCICTTNKRLPKVTGGQMAAEEEKDETNEGTTNDNRRSSSLNDKNQNILIDRLRNDNLENVPEQTENRKE